MGTVRNALALGLLIFMAGCLGENRKPVGETKPTDATTPPPAPLIIYREITPPGGRSNTLRLSVERSGRGQLEHGTLLSEDALLPDERDDLKSLADAVHWSDLPVEYVPPTSAPLKENAKTYEITYNATSGSRVVTTHDGILSEDDGLLKLRKRLQQVAVRLEDQRR